MRRGREGLCLSAAVLLAACTAPAQVILPGLLDLPVAKGDELKLCPTDGVKDTTPTADCVLAPAKDALAPYAAALRAKGWSGQKADTYWTPPGGGASCLFISAFQTNFSMRERTVLEFRIIDPAKEAGASCQPPP